MLCKKIKTGYTIRLEKRVDLGICLTMGTLPLPAPMITKGTMPTYPSWEHLFSYTSSREDITPPPPRRHFNETFHSINARQTQTKRLQEYPARSLRESSIREKENLRATSNSSLRSFPEKLEPKGRMRLRRLLTEIPELRKPYRLHQFLRE